MKNNTLLTALMISIIGMSNLAIAQNAKVGEHVKLQMPILALPFRGSR